MTAHDTPFPSTNRTSSTPTLVDPRPLFFDATALGRRVLAAVRLDQFDEPTPCTDFDVRGLIGHFVGEVHRLATIGAGGDPFRDPPALTDVDDSEWLAAFDHGVAGVERVWADESLLGQVLDLGWTRMPGAATVSLFINEITVHTWDLAIATGQYVEFDDDVVALAMDTIQRGLDADHRRSTLPEVPFDDVVEVPTHATPIDRLVAWNGRQP